MKRCALKRMEDDEGSVVLGSEDALLTDYAQGVTLAGNCSTTLAKPYNCFGSKLDKH